MNTAQKIHYIQSEYDEWDREQCAVTTLQLAVIQDFENQGFTGSRLNPEDQVKLKDIIYEAIDDELAQLIANMYPAKQDEQSFRDSAYAVLNYLDDLAEKKAYELALEMHNEKEI